VELLGSPAVNVNREVVLLPSLSIKLVTFVVFVWVTGEVGMESLSSGATDKHIKFENPPINELVIALYHLPIVEMKSQHIGLYWDRIRDRYPRCEQQPPIINPADIQPFQAAPGEVFPLPRFWFSSDTHPMLIQVQRNAFIFNWRRGGANEYPHYETVVKDFWQEFEGYKAFIQELASLDVIQRCELTYINVISPNEVFADSAQFMDVLPPIASLYDIQTNDRQLTGLNTTVTYQVNPTLLIDLAIKLGRRLDTKEPVAILELKAHGGPSDLSLEGARSWYDLAHDATYKMFLDATSKKVQKEIWKPL